MIKVTSKKCHGQIAVELLLFSALAVILISGFVTLSMSFVQLSVRGLNKSQAFTIAEAGIEYYRWHLAHAPLDFKDGTGQPGPYTHDYFDKDGKLLGQFTLLITAPPAGSTIVTIRSTGKVFADASIQKVIEVRMGIPSFAKYAWAFNDNVSFSAGASVYGPIHSNAGIRFDGKAYNTVVSSLVSYVDPDHASPSEYAVHTHVNPTDPFPPTALPPRPDVFAAGRTVGVPAIDFTKLTQDLSAIKFAAIASGTYFPSSTVFGYDLSLATSGLYSVYKVTALRKPPVNCTSTGGSSQQGWGLWSILTENIFATGTIPSNGRMFFEDNLWVRGQIDGKRLTVGSGRFPDNTTTRSSITVNNSVRYTNTSGTDVIALIAQKNLNIGLMSDDSLRIDAAIVAINGRVGRYSYTSDCGSTRSRALLTTYGMLGSALRSGVYYSSTNGYQARSYNYDPNLLYGPPPGFPLTSDQYTLLSWDEIQ